MITEIYEKTGMILEGGGSKGVFTAGVLDHLMKMGIQTSYVSGVSAGSCNALDYVSDQPGRTRKSMIIRDKAMKYASFKNIVKKRSFFDMDLLFDRFPNELVPFDYDTYFENVKDGIECEIVVTNCLTGKVEYIAVRSGKKRLMDVARASSTLPFLAPIAYIDGLPYMDGGFADSVPVGRSIMLGNRKNIVILTKRKGYRMSEPKAAYRELMIERYGRDYPKFVTTALHRHVMYNRQMDIIDRLEDEGRIFVIRPEIKPVSRTEQNADLLDEFYNHGVERAVESYDDLKTYLDEGKDK